MNVTLFSLIIWTALFLKSCNSEDGFTREGDHWLNDGSVPNTDRKLYAFIQTLFTEYKRVFKLQDAAAMAEKYTDDCVYIHQDLGILRGKEAVQEGYQEQFNSNKASVKLEPLKASDFGTLGDGYVHISVRVHFLNKDNIKIGESVVLVILKNMEDGYKHYFKAELTDLSKPFVWPALL